MITNKQIRAAYKKLCPDVNLSIIDLFVSLIQDAIRKQDGSIFANRKAKQLKKVFEILAGIHMPHEFDAAHQTFDQWVFYYSIAQKLPITGHLLNRLRSYGIYKPVPDTYCVNNDGGWDLISGHFTVRKNTIAITHLHGRVFEIYTNDPNLHVVKLTHPNQDIASDASYRRIA